jgi:AcrR family transcriptional regulator
MKDMTAKTPADATREEILRHAIDLFGHYGFNKTNIADIAERSNMSPGNIYRYFKNKQAIGVAVVGCYFEMTQAAMDTVLLIPEGSPEDRLRKFIETGVVHLKDELARNPKIVELAEFICNDEDGLEVLSAHVTWRRQRLIAELRRGIANGDFADHDPEQTAIAMMHSVKMFLMPMALAQWRDPETILPELNMVLDLMFRGVHARS